MSRKTTFDKVNDVIIKEIIAKEGLTDLKKKIEIVSIAISILGGVMSAEAEGSARTRKQIADQIEVDMRFYTKTLKDNVLERATGLRLVK